MASGSDGVDYQKVIVLLYIRLLIIDMTINNMRSARTAR